MSPPPASRSKRPATRDRRTAGGIDRALAAAAAAITGGFGVPRLLATWRGRFIAAWLVVQLALPLLYYTARHDPHDERFAWRMFSPMHMVQCVPAFTVDDRPVVLGRRFHQAWINIAKRGRFSVVEAMAERLCDDNPDKRVGLTLTCTRVGGETRTWSRHDACPVPNL